jgi:triacylglycerol lipase
MSDQDSTPATINALTHATLTLCILSYTRNFSTIPALVQSQLPDIIPGGWSGLWGPAQSPDQSNLAFVTGYSPTQSGALQSIYVTVRGTNLYTGEDPWGVYKQILEDMDATSQVMLPWTAPGNPERIASGTAAGLQNLIALTDPTTHVSLGDYLTGVLGQYPNAKTVVTGHSLGGCLATVVAPWIKQIRPSSNTAPIQPITFAAPTAGNGSFAEDYSTAFYWARRIQNTLDTVPLAFANLSQIPNLYARYGLDVPPDVQTFINALAPGMASYYAQPTAGTHLVPGIFLVNAQWDWITEAWYQHHPSTYLKFLQMQSAEEKSAPG